MLLLLSGCPRRFDPAAAPPSTSSDVRVTARFAACRKLFAEQKPAADACLARFAEQQRGEPLARSAQLLRGRIALRRGDFQAAIALLAPLARTPAVSLSKAAVPALAAALAEAYERAGKVDLAIAQLERLHGATDRPVERLHAKLALERLIDRRLDLAGVRALWTTSRDGSLLRAFCARRLIGEAQGRGDLAAADALAARAGDALRKHGLAPTIARLAGSRVGLLLPFSGRYRRVGQLGFEGAAVAAGAFSGAQKPLELFVGNSGQTALAAARRLVQREHVVALVGVFDPVAARAVAQLAHDQRVPYLTLAAALPSTSPWVLRALPRGAARAEALARHVGEALRRPRVLVVAPESRYGTRSAGDFQRALAGRGQITAVLRYTTRTTSFVALAKRIAVHHFDAIFVPDTARRLALLAPALAQARCWARSPGQSAPAGGQAFLLLATADGLDQHLLRSAGRYIQGAVLAPGFYADDQARASGPLLREYQRVLGHAPGPVEAFTHDAVLALRAALAAGARTPAGLLRVLRQQTTQGLTGTPRFGADGSRSDAPPLYRVVGDKIRLLESTRGEGLAGPSRRAAGLARPGP